MADGFVIMSVGKKKTGKTTQTKKVLTDIYNNDPQREIYIYDINKEYSDFYPEKFVIFESFMNKIKDEKKSFLLIEEATIFFNNRSVSKELQRLLVTTRHDDNIIYLNFHSWRSVPRYIMDMVDYVRVFKTNDSIELVEKKTDNPNVLKAYKSVMDSEDRFATKLVDMYD